MPEKSAVIYAAQADPRTERMSKLNLSIATTDCDHFRDFRLGIVQAEGIDHTWLNLGHHECFARFTANREFDRCASSRAWRVVTGLR